MITTLVVFWFICVLLVSKSGRSGGRNTPMPPPHLKPKNKKL